MDDNLQDLLKSQQSLYDKYSNQLSNIKKLQVPSIFNDIDNLIKPNLNTNININTNTNDNNNQNQKEENILIDNFKKDEDGIITRKIKMNIPTENSNINTPNSKKESEKIEFNDEEIKINNNDCLKDIVNININENEIIEKFNNSDLTEKSNNISNKEIISENKISFEIKNSMDIFDKILQENSIDLKDVEKDKSPINSQTNSQIQSRNQSQRNSNVNSPNRSRDLNENKKIDNENIEDFIDTENEISDINLLTPSEENKKEKNDEDEKIIDK